MRPVNSSRIVRKYLQTGGEFREIWIETYNFVTTKVGEGSGTSDFHESRGEARMYEYIYRRKISSRIMGFERETRNSIRIRDFEAIRNHPPLVFPTRFLFLPFFFSTLIPAPLHRFNSCSLTSSTLDREIPTLSLFHVVVVVVVVDIHVPSLSSLVSSRAGS